MFLQRRSPERQFQLRGLLRLADGRRLDGRGLYRYMLAGPVILSANVLRMTFFLVYRRRAARSSIQDENI